MSGKIILVTGAAGFIGSNLVDRLLSQGYQVIGIDNFDDFYPREIKENNLMDAMKSDKFNFCEGDIRNKDFLSKIFAESKIEMVIHLAAKAGVRPSILEPAPYFDVNVTGTLNVLEAMRLFSVSKLIFSSSSSVYGNNKKVPFSEQDNVDNPISPYAASKKAAELLCHTYYHLYNFDIFCLRLFTVYGPRQRPDLAINKFTNLILKDEPIPLFGDGNTGRDYTYVDDIIEGMLASIDKIKGYQIINLGDSKTISLNKLVELISTTIKKNVKKIYLPKQPGDVENTYADISKAVLLLDYTPRISINLGIEKYFRWLQK